MKNFFVISVVLFFCAAAFVPSSAVAAYAGNCLQFDGTDESVNLGTGAELALTSGAFTVEAWIDPSEKTNICTLLGRRNSGAANPGYALYVNTYDTADRRILFETEGAVAYSVDPAIEWDGWQHVAITWDASDLRMYVNGEEVSTTGSVNITDASVDARIGAMASDDYFYEGRMDELRIWSTNRSQSLIEQYMGRTIATNTAELTAYYRFDHGSGTQLDDVTGSGHDGTLIGMTDADWIESTAPLADFSLDTNAVLTQTLGLNDPADAGWGDYNNDGLLDIALSGSWDEGGGGTIRISEVFQNLGAGTFTNLPGTLDPASDCSLEWHDIDGDNDLDLFLSGDTTSGVRAVLYRNDVPAGGGFVATDPSATNMFFRDIAIADFDGDGDPDAVTVYSGDDVRLWLQDSGLFSPADVDIPPVTGYSWRLAAGDCDSDGDPDLAVGVGDIVKVYRNDLVTDGVFSNIIYVSSKLVYRSDLAWGDMDEDGDLDLVMVGGNKVIVLENGVPQGGSFSEAYYVDAYRYYQSLALGDYDNDGDLDMVASGDFAYMPKTMLYRNEGGFTFSQIRALDGGGRRGRLGWGDYDRDGDLDLFSVSANGFGPTTNEIWRNECPVSNTVPSAPAAIQVEVVSATAPCGVLRWSAASDAETPTALLGYNVRLFDPATSNYLVSPMADTNTGLRRLPGHGNRGPHRRLDLNGIVETGGVYRAAVQAIDTAWAGGAWSREVTIDYGSPPTVGACRLDHLGTRTLVVSTTVTGDNLDERGLLWATNGPAFLSEGDTVSTYPFGPGVTGDGIVLSNLTAGATYEVRAYARRGDVAYYSEPLSVTPDRWSAIQISTQIACRLSAGDYDNDGDLDLAVGLTDDGAGDQPILRNDDGTFTNALSAPDCGGKAGVQWGDIDNDGDLDLLTGGNDSAYNVKLYRNDVATGGGFISIYGNTNLYEEHNWKGSAAFVDYDSDGNLDFMQTGDLYGDIITRLVRNDDGVFTNVAFSVEDVYVCRFDWGDYDSDGDMDLALNGWKEDDSYIAKIYRNDTPQGGGFTNIGANLQTPYTWNPISWGDYDGDGDLDLLQLWTHTSPNYKATWLYRNDGGDTFTAVTNAGFPVLTDAWSDDVVAEWGDADNDGDLDLLFYGGIESPDDAVLVCVNQGDGTFTNEVVATGFSERRSGGVWGDFDGDGDLDAAVALDESGIYLFRNNLDWGNAQTPPTAPNSLNSTSVGSNAVNLSWNTATDTETPAGTLSYNLRVGEVPEGGDAMAGNADAASGWRWLSGRGNAGLNTNWTLRGLSPGHYYWSVQSVDNQFSGSAWSTQGTFRVGNVWLIDAAAGEHGAITPSGIVAIADGGSTNFAITPDTYYHVDDVTTNGASVGVVTAFTWSNVTADGTIHADFAADLAAQSTPHWWLAQYGLTNGGWTFNQAETNNPDNDPFTSKDEYIADTNPTDSNDYLRITGIAVASPPVVSFESSSNRLYTMYGCSNLLDGAWTNIPGAGPRMGSGGSDSMQDTNRPTAGPFYRLGVEVP